jgi:hypothetical protein
VLHLEMSLGVMTEFVSVASTGPCSGNGSVSIAGTLAAEGTGTLEGTFKNCNNSDAWTWNGAFAVRVIAGPQSAAPEAQLVFDKLIAEDGTFTETFSGTLDALATGGGATQFTANLAYQDSQSLWQVEPQNLKVNSTYDRTDSLSGRLFESTLGYVDLTTQTPFNFADSQTTFQPGARVHLEGASSALSGHSTDEYV